MARYGTRGQKVVPHIGDTGNRGATTLGQSNSVPSDETWNEVPENQRNFKLNLWVLVPLVN